ncbi:MAG: MFS transporter, partial [Candidatus Hydrogenedentes bacterium]|nr:MFS transporter [Candidatus Hydrogenedentota bacterium]
MRNNPRFVLVLCNAGMACVALGASLIPIYLTTFAEVFGGLGAGELGRIAGLLFAGFIFGIATTGPLADRFGAKPFVLLGTVASVAGLLLLATTWNYTSLLVAAFVIGLGAGVIDMVMSPIVSALAIDNRTAALNRLHAFYCLGAISTLAIASIMLRVGAPWRWVVAAFAVVPAVVFLGFMSAVGVWSSLYAKTSGRAITLALASWLVGKIFFSVAAVLLVFIAMLGYYLIWAAFGLIIGRSSATMPQP